MTSVWNNKKITDIKAAVFSGKGSVPMENTAAFFVRETIYINYITDIENSIRKSGRVFENKQKLL
ncbi:hypothetical protein [Blautia luti]|uniref:hypothetical protein n=1 Tax=Blautia TaxID=572511 RepID=UPI001182B8D4|nr:hypothetical protein [Blautia luti]MBE5705273.1 hypothetical protein [Ruminococcus sp.]